VVAKRLEQIEASIERYLSELETADRQPHARNQDQPPQR
jgi:hypothetical protein